MELGQQMVGHERNFDQGEKSANVIFWYSCWCGPSWEWFHEIVHDTTVNLWYSLQGWLKDLFIGAGWVLGITAN